MVSLAAACKINIFVRTIDWFQFCQKICKITGSSDFLRKLINIMNHGKNYKVSAIWFKQNKKQCHINIIEDFIMLIIFFKLSITKNFF